MKPKLLLSIRNANEALLVSTRDIGIIDVKEPGNGALGCVSKSVLQEILATLPPTGCMSIALGELNESGDTRFGVELLSRFKFAKIGLAGVVERADWRIDWKRKLDLLPKAVGRVAVAYLDAHLCKAPPIGEVIELATQFGCRAVLLDTYEKSAGDLLTHLQPKQLAEIVRKIKMDSMLAVVAGSVSLGTLETVLTCEPDFVGIRGAVCQSERAGPICESKLDRFVNRFLGIVDAKFSFQG